jgi:Tfp pilus assembly protein PilW
MTSILQQRGTTRDLQRGLSLVELMVSITIGMIIVAAVLAAYVSSSEAGKFTEAQSRMDEDGNAALAVLAQQLRMAGNNPRQPNYMGNPASNPVFTTGTFAIRGCDGSFGGTTHPLNVASITCTGESVTAPDSIAVVYEGDRFNTVRTTSTNAATDCLGSSLPSTTTDVNVWNGASTVTSTVTYTVVLYRNLHRHHVAQPLLPGQWQCESAAVGGKRRGHANHLRHFCSHHFHHDRGRLPERFGDQCHRNASAAC